MADGAVMGCYSGMALAEEDHCVGVTGKNFPEVGPGVVIMYVLTYCKNLEFGGEDAFISLFDSDIKSFNS